VVTVGDRSKPGGVIAVRPVSGGASAVWPMTGSTSCCLGGTLSRRPGPHSQGSRTRWA